MTLLYQGKHRQSLADDTDIKALEAAREGNQDVETDTMDEAAPDAETLPEPVNVEEETFKKRYSDLRRHMAAKEKEWQSKFADFERKLEDAGKTKLELPEAADPSELEAWMRQYPDVARIVSQIAEMQAEKQTKDIKKQLESVAEERRRNAREKAEMKLREAHSDIDTLRNDPHFHAWASDQPRTIQDALYNNEDDWREASRAIDLYKSDKEKLGPVKKTRPRRDEVAASAPIVARNTAEPNNSNGKKMWKESEIQRLDWRSYDKNEADIMLARSEGRIIYDMSQKMASM